MNEFYECRACGRDLPTTEFHRASRSRRGFISTCRTCRAKTRNDYRYVPMDERFDLIQSKDVARFAAFVEPDLESGCWNWTGGRVGAYPNFWFAGNRVRAHRFALWASGERFDLDAQVHHRCVNALCVNPAHLEALSGEEHRAIHAEIRKTTSRPRKTRRRKKVEAQ